MPPPPSPQKIFLPAIVLLCITFFLWTDAAVDPTLSLRQVYLALVMFGAVLFFSFRVPSSILKSKSILFLAAYILFSWLSIFRAQDASVSLFELSKITLFPFLILFFCSLALLPSSSFVKNMAAGITLSSALLVIIGYVELFYYTNFLSEDVTLPDNPVYATFGNRNIFSEMILLFIPFQVICLFQNKNSRVQWPIAALVLLSLLLILFLQTRAVWLALAGSSFILFLLFSKQILLFLSLRPLRAVPSRTLRLTAVILLLLAGAAAFPVYKSVSQRISKTLHDLNEKDSINPVSERLTWWKKTVQMIEEHPLAGVGPGNWMINYPKYGLTGSHAEYGDLSFREPHNDYLWIWAESGIFALLFYIFYLLSMVVTAMKIIYSKLFSTHEKMIAACSLFGILCYMIISVFSFPKERIEHILILGLFSSFILTLHFPRIAPSLREDGGRLISLKYPGLLVSFAAAMIGLFNLTGEVHAKKAELARIRGDFKKVIDEGEKASNLFFHITPTGMPVDFYPAIGNYHLGNYKQAIPFFQQALTHTPYQVLALHFLATSYGMLGDENNAAKYYEQALAVSGSLDYSKLNLALSYYNLGEYEPAKNILLKINDEAVIKNNLENIGIILSHSFPSGNGTLPPPDTTEARKLFYRLKAGLQKS